MFLLFPHPPFFSPLTLRLPSLTNTRPHEPSAFPHPPGRCACGTTCSKSIGRAPLPAASMTIRSARSCTSDTTSPSPSCHPYRMYSSASSARLRTWSEARGISMAPPWRLAKRTTSPGGGSGTRALAPAHGARHTAHGTRRTAHSRHRTATGHRSTHASLPATSPFTIDMAGLETNGVMGSTCASAHSTRWPHHLALSQSPYAKSDMPLLSRSSSRSTTSPPPTLNLPTPSLSPSLSLPLRLPLPLPLSLPP